MAIYLQILTLLMVFFFLFFLIFKMHFLTIYEMFTWCVSLLPFPSPLSPWGCLKPSAWTGPCEPPRVVIGQGSFRYSDTACKMQGTSSGTSIPSASRICHCKNKINIKRKCAMIPHCHHSEVRFYCKKTELSEEMQIKLKWGVWTLILSIFYKYFMVGTLE